jgi:hypothetical protein
VPGTSKNFESKPTPATKKPETTSWCSDYNRYAAQEVVDNSLIFKEN